MGPQRRSSGNPSQTHIDPRRPDFLSSHPRHRSASRCPGQCAPVPRPAAPANATRGLSRQHRRPGLRRGIREGFVRGRRFLHPSSASPSWRRRESRSTTPRRRAGSRTAADRPCASTSCGCGGADACGVPQLRLDREHRSVKPLAEIVINGLPATTAVAKGDQWVFRVYAVRFGATHRFSSPPKHARRSTGLSRSGVDVRRMTPGGEQAASRCTSRLRGRAGRHGREARRPHDDARTARSNASACSMGSGPTTASTRRLRQVVVE